jgi:hypothetical protein
MLGTGHANIPPPCRTWKMVADRLRNEAKNQQLLTW